MKVVLMVYQLPMNTSCVKHCPDLFVRFPVVTLKVKNRMTRRRNYKQVPCARDSELSGADYLEFDDSSPGRHQFQSQRESLPTILRESKWTR